MSEDTIETNVTQDSNMTESFYDEDFPCLCDMTGKLVLIEHIDFSFEFAIKLHVLHNAIQAIIKWNRDKLSGPGDRCMNLWGNYEYVRYKHGQDASEKDMSKARDFFMKYKVLFAAVWEGMLEPNYVQDYLRNLVTFDELKDSFDDLPEKIFDDAKTIADIEKIVRENKLFDMND